MWELQWFHGLKPNNFEVLAFKTTGQASALTVSNLRLETVKLNRWEIYYLGAGEKKSSVYKFNSLYVVCCSKNLNPSILTVCSYPLSPTPRVAISLARCFITSIKSLSGMV